MSKNNIMKRTEWLLFLEHIWKIFSSVAQRTAKNGAFLNKLLNAVEDNELFGLATYNPADDRQKTTVGFQFSSAVALHTCHAAFDAHLVDKNWKEIAVAVTAASPLALALHTSKHVASPQIGRLKRFKTLKKKDSYHHFFTFSNNKL